MAGMKKVAADFFDACETGKGWEKCKAYCDKDATFSSQADALDGVTTLADYTEWMKNLLTAIPDGQYEIRSFAVDEEREKVSVYAVLSGTNTGDGGPVEPTGKAVEADYVYVMDFDGGSISHMTKIWNDGYSVRQLGWA